MMIDHFISDLRGRVSFLVNNVRVLGETVVIYKKDRLEIKKGHRLVILGNSISEKSLLDDEVIRILCKTKEKQPEQICILAGNDDILKLRLHAKAELNVTSIKNRTKYQDSLTKDSSWTDYSCNVKGEDVKLTGYKGTIRAEDSRLLLCYLKWMLNDEMEVNNVEEMEKYICVPINDPKGIYRTYFTLSDMVYFENNTLAFHGGVTTRSFDVTAQTSFTLKQWVHDTNFHYHYELEQLWKNGENPNLPSIARGLVYHGLVTMNDEGVNILRERDWTEDEADIIEDTIEYTYDETTSEPFQYVHTDDPSIPNFFQDTFLHHLYEEENIRYIVLGHQPFGTTSFGSMFIHQEIVFMSLDVTRAMDKSNMTCVATITKDEYWIDGNYDGGKKKQKDLIRLTEAHELTDGTTCTMNGFRGDDPVKFCLIRTE